MPTTTETAATLEDCEINRLRVTTDFRLSLRFRDGLIAELDFADWVRETDGPLAEPLRDPEFFAQVSLDDGALIWPNQYDIAPETIRLWAERGFVQSR
ncbi:MAG TPA: DUF2442 domain-containing protein [Prosthecobacter sp.]|nr:DUF2442 domain-containing protein [Prosthecobacter sp.]